MLLGLRAASTQPGKCRTRGARHPFRGRGAGASHGTPESPWGRHFRLLVTGQPHDSREREAAGAPGGAGLGPHTGTVCPLRQAQGTEALRSHLPQQPGPGADDPRPGCAHKHGLPQRPHLPSSWPSGSTAGPDACPAQPSSCCSAQQAAQAVSTVILDYKPG